MFLGENESTLLQREVQKLTPSPVVELYELDLTKIGDDSILYFHNGTNGMTNRLEEVSFKGIRYVALPIVVKGFEMSGTGEPPRPSLTIMNVGGFLSSLVLKTNDLVGATFTRRRTFAKYLDDMPEAKSLGYAPQYPPDIFIVERKVRENRQTVEFELGTGFDLDGIRYPLRQIISGYCGHDYRGPGCRFAEPMVIADLKNRLQPGAGSDYKTPCFKGPFVATKEYESANSVSYTVDGVRGIYVAKSNPPVGTLPTNTTYWKQVQRYREKYSSEVESTVEGIDYTDYVAGDVVFIDNDDFPVFCIVREEITGFVPCAFPPPNSLYWVTDVCVKLIHACSYRFDPEGVNRPLPYGGFPGALSLPSV